MSSSDVSSVTKYFSTAAEGFTTTLASTIASGATSVPLNSTSGLTNGAVFVGIIEPGATAQQTFTGTVDVGGSQITNVVWVRGSNTGHAGGVTIVDYVSGASHNMTTAGILKQHTQAGAHTGITTDTLASTGNVTVGGALAVIGASTLTGAIGGAGYDLKTIANSYKFSVYRNAAANTGNNTYGLITFDTKEFDTGTNYDTSTGKFTAPVSGFYQFNFGSGFSATAGFCAIALFKNGAEFKRGTEIVSAGSTDTQLVGAVMIQLAATDYVQVFIQSPAANALQVGSAIRNYFSGFLVSAT